METSGADDGTAAAAAAAPLSSLPGQEEGNKDPTNEEAREFMMSGAGAGTAMKNLPPPRIAPAQPAGSFRTLLCWNAHF